MTERRVSIAVEGKVILDADVTKAQQKIKGLERGSDTIGSGAPIPPTPPPAPAAPAAPGPAPAPGHNPLNASNPRYYEHLAERSYHAMAARHHQARTPSDFREIGDRMERALYNANQSGNRELVNKLTDLKGEIAKLEDEMQRRRQQAQQGGSGGGGGDGQGGPPGSPWGDRMNHAGRWLASQGQDAALGRLTGMFGGQVGGAMFGGAARLLGGPVGMLLGGASAANWAFNALSNKITEANAPARTEITGYADLARQYGSSQNMMGYLRDENGWTKENFSRLGYSATQAAHTAAVYDRPGNPNRVPGQSGEAGVMNDVTSILQFARSTGTEETRAATLAQQLGRMNNATPEAGGADGVLRVMKLAMTEGVKHGIAQSETLNSLSTAVQRNTGRGFSTNDTALAMLASIQGRLNGTTEDGKRFLFGATMRGEHGLGAMQGVMQGLGDGGGDDGMRFMLIRGLIDKGLPTAENAGMGGTSEGAYYDQLKKESPVMAAEYLMKRAGSGKNPQVLAALAQTVDEASGGSVALKTMLYKQIAPQLSDEQIAEIVGGVDGGIGGIFAKAANGQTLQRYKNGESLTADPQGNNPLANQNMWLRVAEQDRELLKSLASLNLTAGLEGVLDGFKSGVSDLRAQLSNLLGGPMVDGGNYAGRTGVGFQNPSRAPGALPESQSPTAGGGNTVGQDPSTTGAGGGSGGSGAGGSGGANTGGGAAGGPLRNSMPGAPTSLPKAGLTFPNSSMNNARTIAAVAQVESSNGAAPGMNAPRPGGAMGLFQMQSRWLFGPKGWAKEAGVDMRNRDGTAVSSEAQARQWQMDNPDLADRIAANRLHRIETAIRARYAKEGLKLTDAQAAGFTEVLWHRNGGGNIEAALTLPLTAPGNPLAPLVKNGKLITNANLLSRNGAESDRDSYNKTVAAFTSQNLKPAAIRGSGAARGTGAARLAPESEAVIFTQGFGENKNSKKYGYDERGHLGWDFEIGRLGVGGDVVHSRTEGVVVQAGDNKSWGGKTVIVERPDKYRVLHGHLGSVKVKQGDKVTTATPIGTEGATGGPKGMKPHLHIEVWDAKGNSVNPSAIFGERDLKKGQRVKGFRTGGYTGDHARDEVAGIVHGQEFVMTAEATRKHRQVLEAMNQGVSPQGGQINVSLGGTLQLNVALSAGAQAEVQREYQAFQGRVARVVTTDIQNSRGPRG